MRSVARVGVCLALCAAGTSAATAGAHAATSRPSLRPLKVSIHFTKERYAPHAKAHIEIALKNTGSATLRRIGAACDRAGDPDELGNRGANWGRLAASAQGVTLAPNSTRLFTVIATVPSAAQRAGQVVVACDFGYHNVDSGYRPRTADSARVPGQSGALQGVVQHPVAGKPGTMVALKGVRAVLVDPTTCPIRTRTGATGTKGRFEVTHTPAGSWYKLYLFLPRGWKLRPAGGNPTNAQVFGNDTTHMYFEAVRGSARRPTLPTKCT